MGGFLPSEGSVSLDVWCPFELVDSLAGGTVVYVTTVVRPVVVETLVLTVVDCVGDTPLEGTEPCPVVDEVVVCAGNVSVSKCAKRNG